MNLNRNNSLKPAFCSAGKALRSHRYNTDCTRAAFKRFGLVCYIIRRGEDVRGPHYEPGISHSRLERSAQ